jgi:hypothetical protein
MMMLSFGCGSDKRQLINNTASLPDSFKFDEMGLTRVINSAINRKKSTMSTLYGNDVAFSHAAATADSSYPAGSVLALVTWKQQEDPNWFGANIPGELAGIELIRVNGPATAISYRQYSGSALRPALDRDTVQVHTRIRYILGEKPSVMP